MSVYAEAPRVLDFIRNSRELFFDSVRDPVAKMMNNSPRDKTYIEPGPSLERDPAQMRQGQPGQPTNAMPALISADDERNKTKVVVFDKTTLPKTLSFARDETYLNNKAVKPSYLVEELSTMANFPMQKRKKGVNLKIVFPESTSRPVRLTVEENSSVETVIAAALKQYHAEMRVPPLNQNAKAWLLRLVEDNNSVDDSIPPLGHAQTIGKLGTCFGLCKNPKYKEEFMVPMPGKGILKINLPSGEHMVLNWQAKMTLCEVLTKLWKKRQMDTTAYTFTLPTSELPLDENATLEELGIYELSLVEKTKAQPTEPLPHRERPVHPAQRCAFQQFKVMKLKKGPWGKDDERTIGIDGQHIAFEYIKRARIKTVQRLLKTVVRVGLVGEAKPSQFFIVFKSDQGNGELDDRYEAHSPADAQEIVNKIDYLVHMNP